MGSGWSSFCVHGSKLTDLLTVGNLWLFFVKESPYFDFSSEGKGFLFQIVK
ncbi:hypothetical protein GCM10007938_13970 [Vibrio zhanjiangensis]|uniref:Uncharacterized protein n=1 Tax=Vibrio zhanjiangensis TaxID=1046128 RepID=A0ABQ6EXD3_9VIBR|nr:hypothetical protein GCM10007938_13970 [Vibrio zhanjiangensis]